MALQDNEIPQGVVSGSGWGDGGNFLSNLGSGVGDFISDPFGSKAVASATKEAARIEVAAAEQARKELKETAAVTERDILEPGYKAAGAELDQAEQDAIEIVTTYFEQGLNEIEGGFQQAINTVAETKAAVLGQISTTKESASKVVADEIGKAIGVVNEKYAPYIELGDFGIEKIKALYADPSYIENLPGYKFGLEQGLKGIQRYASAAGKSGGGAFMKGLARYAQDYAGTKFEEEKNSLLQMVDRGLMAVGQATGLETQLRQNLAGALGDIEMTTGMSSASVMERFGLTTAGLQEQLATTIGSSKIGLGQSLADITLQTGGARSTLETKRASDIANLRLGTATTGAQLGIQAAASQAAGIRGAAEAAMSGRQALWNLALGGAGLAVGGIQGYAISQGLKQLSMPQFTPFPQTPSAIPSEGYDYSVPTPKFTYGGNQ